MSNPEEIERNRLHKLSSFIIGKDDYLGRKIYDVYSKADAFVIYSTDPNCSIKGIAIYIDTKDPDDEIPINNFQAVKGDFDKLKSVSDRCIDKSFSARAAHALSVAIFGKPAEAKTILSDIFKDIEAAYAERVIGKLVYISGTFLVTVLFSSFALCLYFGQYKFLIGKTDFYELMLTCSLATFGGLISVSRNLTKINVDKGLGKWPYFVYGIERNIFSVVGGVFIFLLIKSNLLFGFINSMENDLYGLLTFGFLAGFSETLIPNALKNLEERANKETCK